MFFDEQCMQLLSTIDHPYEAKMGGLSRIGTSSIDVIVGTETLRIEGSRCKQQYKQKRSKSHRQQKKMQLYMETAATKVLERESNHKTL